MIRILCVVQCVHSKYSQVYKFLPYTSDAIHSDLINCMLILQTELLTPIQKFAREIRVTQYLHHTSNYLCTYLFIFTSMNIFANKIYDFFFQKKNTCELFFFLSNFLSFYHFSLIPFSFCLLSLCIYFLHLFWPIFSRVSATPECKLYCQFLVCQSGTCVSV